MWGNENNLFVLKLGWTNLTIEKSTQLILLVRSIWIDSKYLMVIKVKVEK